MWQLRSLHHRLDLPSIVHIATLGLSYLRRTGKVVLSTYVGGSHSPLSHHAPHAHSDLDLYFVIVSVTPTYLVDPLVCAYLSMAYRRGISAHLVDDDTFHLSPASDLTLLDIPWTHP